jgi:hypothetical protein
MIQGKIIWLEEGDEDLGAKEYDAHIIVKNGKIIKNTLGVIAPADHADKQMKRHIHLELMKGVMAGGPIDFENGEGPVPPLDHIRLISDVVAEQVDDVMKLWEESGWL